MGLYQREYNKTDHGRTLISITVMILNFWTDRPEHTVQTQIRLLRGAV